MAHFHVEPHPFHKRELLYLTTMRRNRQKQPSWQYNLDKTSIEYIATTLSRLFELLELQLARYIYPIVKIASAKKYTMEP